MGQDERKLVARLQAGKLTDWDGRIGRRGFIGGAAALTGAALIDALTQQALVYRNAALASGLLQPSALIRPSFSIDVHRREDLLFLRFDGYNLLQKGQSLVRGLAGRECTLTVTFLPQHVAEQAFDETAKPASPGSTQARVAAPSRLAFTVPASRLPLPLTIESLLGWQSLLPALPAAANYDGDLAHASNRGKPKHTVLRRAPKTHAKTHAATHAAKTHGAKAHAATPHAAKQHPRARAASGSPPALGEPGPEQTAIELPYHLALSPTAAGRWSHETYPVTIEGATELWRTELYTPFGDYEVLGGAVRAVWAYDTNRGTPTLESGQAGSAPFQSALTPYQRYEIVRASSDFTIKGRADISARKLLLSARGGSLSADANWNTDVLGIASWSHEATQGRDQYVKVVDKGFLFPFGHHVSLVTVTEREFDEQGSQTVGYLRQSQYLVVADPTVSYDPADNPAVLNSGRDFPFRSIEIKDTGSPKLGKVTPFVDPVVHLPFFSWQILSTQFPPFVPTTSSGEPVNWHFVGTDWSGRQTSFQAQAVWVYYEDGIDWSRMGFVRDKYNSLDPADPIRTTDFGGKTLTYAESLDAGDTDLPTFAMTFAASSGAELSDATNESADVPGFLPSLRPAIAGKATGAQATVSMPAAEQASGAALANNGRPSIAYYEGFVENGFYGAQSKVNQGQVFLQILGDATKAPALTFSGAPGTINKNGAVISPNIQLQGLSRSLGPVADLDKTFAGHFDPKTVFAALTGPQAPRLLGGVSLRDIIKEASMLDGGGSPDAPNPQFLQIKSTTKGNVATTVVSWQPKVANPPNPQPDGSASPTIITERTDGTPGQYPLSFKLQCTIVTDLMNPRGSTYTIYGELDNFVINLVTKGDDNFIAVTFDSFSFTSVSGGKPKLKPKIAKVDFQGALKFVEQLEEFMPQTGGGGPNILELLDSISTDLSLKLPSIDVGIISISHIAIDTGFKLPFDGTPTLFSFGFAGPANPFALAIGIFGGGGFLNLSIGSAGVQSITGSFEFGAMAAFDIGVASGNVTVVAGFYFAYDVDVTKNPKVTTCVLSGFVKLSGNLTVIEIITLSLEFDLTLTYQEVGSAKQLTGTATLVVSVSLLYFHKSVTLTASKTFVNSGSSSHASSAHRRGYAELNGPHTFADQMQQSDWNTYCQAFAPVS